MFSRLAARMVRRPGRATVILVLIVAAAASVGGSAPVRLADSPGDDFADTSAETWTTLDRLEEARGDGGNDLLVTVDLSEDPWPSEAAQQRVREVVEVLEDDERISRVTAPTAAPQNVIPPIAGSADAAAANARAELAARYVAPKGRGVLVAATVMGSADDNDVGVDARERLDELDEGNVQVGGFALVDEDLNQQVETDLGRAEMYAFPLLFVVSIWVFGSIVSALMPLITGMAAIMLTFLGLVLFDTVEPMSVFAVNLVFAVALGLGVDYSLLIITRMREARAVGHGPRSAVLAAVRGTATTITFSALTVASAMGALTLFPQRFLWSMGVGGVMASLLAAVTSLTLLPAILALLGDRVEKLSPPGRRAALKRRAAGESGGGWARLAHFVMGRPGLVALVTGGALLLLASPMLRVEFTGVDATVLPAAAESRQVAETVRRDYPRVGATQLNIVAESPPDALDAAVAEALEDAGSSAAAAGPAPPAQAVGKGLSIVELPLVQHPNTDESHELLRELRREIPGGPGELVGITGATSVTVDTLDSFSEHIPAAVAWTIFSTLVLVFLFTGSVILPIKSVLMNVLGIGAALSLLVLIFQDGRFESLLGYTSQGALESSQPILIIAIAFGLSTDYGIILLGRIREERQKGVTDREAVAAGLERTGSLITSAALLLSIALGAFVTSQIVFIQQVGVGTVAAVIIDATIVRALLVPSLMALLGHWNWWAPGPLRRLHDRFGVREAHGVDAPTADDLEIDRGRATVEAA